MSTIQKIPHVTMTTLPPTAPASASATGTPSRAAAPARPVRPPLLREALGTVLRGLRGESGRTLRDVAESARVSPGYLSEIERGRKEASSELLAAVSAALDVSLPEILIRAVGELAPAAVAAEAQAILAA